jgi:type IV secretory pathway protease TraF
MTVSHAAAPPAGDKTSAPTRWIALALAAVALAGLAAAYASGRSLSVKIGDYALDFGADPEMGAVLDAALAARPDDVAALLAARGFHRVTSPGLVDALARIDAAKAEGMAVTQGVRRLLWNLQGPFSGAGVLSEADARFLTALEDVDRRATAEPGGAVIVELWQRSLERRSPLPLRLFAARVVPVRAGEPGVVYFCPPADGRLDGKHAAVFRKDTDAALDGALVADDRGRLDCPAEGVSVRALFAGAPMTLGVDPARYAAFAGTDGTVDGGAAGGVPATVEIQPSRRAAARAP